MGPINQPVTPGTPGGETDQDFHKGAVEGDRPADQPQQGNENAPGLNAEGLPNDPVAIAEDVIGANEDGSQG